MRQLYSDFWSCLFVGFDVICCLDWHINSDGDCFDDGDEIIEFRSWWACLEAARFKCIKHSRLSQFVQFKVEVEIIHRNKTKGMEHTKRDKKEFLFLHTFVKTTVVLVNAPRWNMSKKGWKADCLSV